MGSFYRTCLRCLVVIFYIVLTVVKLSRYKTGQSLDIFSAVVRQFSADHKVVVWQLSGSIWSVLSGRIISFRAKANNKSYFVF